MKTTASGHTLLLWNAGTQSLTARLNNNHQWTITPIKGLDKYINAEDVVLEESGRATIAFERDAGKSRRPVKIIAATSTPTKSWKQKTLATIPQADYEQAGTMGISNRDEKLTITWDRMTNQGVRDYARRLDSNGKWVSVKPDAENWRRGRLGG
jgi:hypothetical protein